MTTRHRGPAEVLEDILGEAETLIRRRLTEAGCELPHLVVAVTPDNQIVLRSNVSADVIRSFGQDLQEVADELTASSQGDTTHLVVPL